jgi:hypothetical protein
MSAHRQKIDKRRMVEPFLELPKEQDARWLRFTLRTCGGPQRQVSITLNNHSAYWLRTACNNHLAAVVKCHQDQTEEWKARLEAKP